MRPSDPIADLLTRIRNSCRMRHRFVDIPRSVLKLEIVKILKEQGFIEGFLERQDSSQGTIRVFLRYTPQRQSVIHGIERYSRPSCRRYVKYKEIPSVLGGMGLSVLTTPKGLMTGEKAKQEKVGGELLCKIW